MDQQYALNTSKNVEILFRWLLLTIRSKLFFTDRDRALAFATGDEEVDADARTDAGSDQFEADTYAALDSFFGTHGRGSYVKPLYLNLKGCGYLEMANLLFAKHRGFYQD